MECFFKKTILREQFILKKMIFVENRLIVLCLKHIVFLRICIRRKTIAISASTTNSVVNLKSCYLKSLSHI